MQSMSVAGRCLLLLLVLLHPMPDAGAQERAGRASVRTFLEGVVEGAEPVIAGRRLQSIDDVTRYYIERDYRHVWTGDGPLAGELGALVQAIQDAADHGFTVERYHLAALASAVASGRATLAAELLATDAFLTQARHRDAGAVDPRALDAGWHLDREVADPVSILSRLSDIQGSPPPGIVITTLGALWPAHDEYRALLRERSRITNLRDDVVPPIPAGPALKPGDTGERVALLKKRLLGPGKHTPLFDEALRSAVLAFQLSSGIDSDGIVGARTLEILNASRFSFIDRIDANLERWRWLPDALPATQVRVNIAAFNLRAVRDGGEELRMNVIVGLPFRRTPVFQRDLRYLVVNPFWNVPTSIAIRDKLPLLKADVAAMTEQGYEARPRDSEQYVPVADIDWASVDRDSFHYQLRQRPGPANALGNLKFMLPNEHAVYLHDTPDISLFDKQERGFSSGCVRLSDPAALAHWLLRGDGSENLAAGLSDEIDSGETLVHYLKAPVPVMIVYFTAFLDADRVVFRRDLYSRDAPILEELRRDR